MIEKDEGERRDLFYRVAGLTYILYLNNCFDLDAANYGNITRFINGSDDRHEPNIMTRVMIANGDYRVGFYAIKDIKAGEELLFEYKFDGENNVKFNIAA